jgi:transposase-like protein
MVNIQALIDDAKCFQTIRSMRWPDGVQCPGCGSAEVTKDGRDDTQAERQRYRCQGCSQRDVQVYAASWSRSKVRGGMPWLTATQIIAV